ncbi:MAG: hypothetical protein K2L31_08275 [Muribaculum sp.]|nr:hypothetical protein [Muribaculum sp.]
MKNLRCTILLSAVLATASCCAENLFHTMLGKTEEETKEKIENTWNHFFTPGDLSKYEADGQRSFYYLDGDDKGFVMDTGNNDVRTEGMSYGMIISVQLDKRDEFDRLWKWSKEHMAYEAGSPWDGYFCWQCDPKGKKLGGSNASDGEIYYVTALFLAGKRWNEPEYTREANEILHKVMSKTGNVTGVYDLFDRDKKMVTFVPDKLGYGFSDPSYHLPAFLDYWAENADSDRDFWSEAAEAARDHLIASAHPVTGLHPDYSNYDGTPYRWRHAGYDTSVYMYDAIRCAMNIGMDYYLTGKDARRQSEVIGRLLRFFQNDGCIHGHFSLDGKNAFGSYSRGMTGSNAVGAIALAKSEDPDRRAIATEFIQRFWDAEPPTGKFRYYEGMVYFLSLLHVSGYFTLDF